MDRASGNDRQGTSAGCCIWGQKTCGTAACRSRKGASVGAGPCGMVLGRKGNPQNKFGAGLCENGSLAACQSDVTILYSCINPTTHNPQCISIHFCCTLLLLTTRDTVADRQLASNSSDEMDSDSGQDIIVVIPPCRCARSSASRLAGRLFVAFTFPAAISVGVSLRRPSRGSSHPNPPCGMNHSASDRAHGDARTLNRVLGAGSAKAFCSCAVLAWGPEPS